MAGQLWWNPALLLILLIEIVNIFDCKPELFHYCFLFKLNLFDVLMNNRDRNTLFSFFFLFLLALVMYNNEKGDEIVLLLLAPNADACERWNKDMWAQTVFPSFAHFSWYKLEIHLCLCLDFSILHFISNVLDFFYYFVFQTQRHSVSTNSDTVSLLQVRVIIGVLLNDTAFQSIAPLVCLTLSLPDTGNELMTLSVTTSLHYLYSKKLQQSASSIRGWSTCWFKESLSTTWSSVGFKWVNSSTDLCCKCSHCKVGQCVRTE